MTIAYMAVAAMGGFVLGWYLSQRAMNRTVRSWERLIQEVVQLNDDILTRGMR